MFVEMLIIFLLTPLMIVGCYIAYHVCKDITQNNKTLGISIFMLYVILFILYLFSVHKIMV